MYRFKTLVVITVLTLLVTGCHPGTTGQTRFQEVVDVHRNLPSSVERSMFPTWFNPDLFPDAEKKVELTDEEWMERLSEQEFCVLRTEQTDMPFANKYNHVDDEGVYVCRGCSLPLFSSSTKFPSSSGWPSFFAPLSTEQVGVKFDTSHGMRRTEVHCIRCSGHLGHIFEDGPRPTGLRYCINSSSIRLITEEIHQLIVEGRTDELDFTIKK